MIKSRFHKAYKPNGKTTFPETINKSGVYIIANKQNKIVYVGYSKSNLYKTMYRHFQSWKDNTQYRATFDKDFKLRIVLTTPKRAKALETALIRKYTPESNKDQQLDLTPYEPEKGAKFLNDTKENYEHLYTTNFEDLPF